MLFQSPGRPEHKQLRVELVSKQASLPDATWGQPALEERQCLSLEEGLFSSCIDSVAAPQVTPLLGFSKEDEDFGIGFFGSPQYT